MNNFWVFISTRYINIYQLTVVVVVPLLYMTYKCIELF